MLCLKEEMSKRVCEAWYSVAPNAVEELYNSKTRKIANRIILVTKGMCNEYWLYDVGIHVCCRVFIGIYLSMLLCIH